MDLIRPLNVVTPSLDGDVLARLALVEHAFTAGDLQRLIPTASVDGIRRVLNRLATQGIVDATRAGNAITYRLNRDHVAADPVIELARLWERSLVRVRDTLGSWETPPRYGAIFGSWGRRTATSESDIDLFLVRPDDAVESTWNDQVHAIETDSTRWTGNDTRSLVMTETEVRSNPGDPVLQSVVRDGIVVSGQASWLRQILTERPSGAPR